VIQAEKIAFSYSEEPLLTDLSFSIEEGDSVAFIGLSGSGKTTLFRLLAGLEQCRSGSLSIRQELSYMMQQDLLLPWNTLLQNLTLFSDQSQQRAEELLIAVGLEGLGSRYPSQLSGGQRQRAALARSLLQDRPILLLDEPFGQLDALTREEMITLVGKIKEEYKKTLLLITHDVNDALQIANRIRHLADGRLVNQWSVPSSEEARHLLRKEILSALRGSPNRS
jgi:ABC-type nitrate/sulfonate/bicarbonate transport system ATPase subunit